MKNNNGLFIFIYKLLYRPNYYYYCIIMVCDYINKE